MSRLSVERIRLNHLRKQFFHPEDTPDFFEIAKAHLGLQSTDYWSPYLSVFARRGDFDAEQMYRALNRGDQLARIHAFRGAVHVVHQDNLSLIIAATGPRLYRMARKSKSLRKLSDQQVETLLDQFLAALEETPLSMRELKQALPTLAPMMRPLLYLGMATGQVVRASTAHARSTFSKYALIKHRFPTTKIEQYNEEEAITQLIHRYIALFGPVSVSDISWWLPTTKTQATATLTTLAGDLVELETPEGPKFMTLSDFETAQSFSPSTETVIAFLPYEDYLPKAFIDRSWFIEPDLQDRLFPRKARSYWPTGTRPTRAPALASGINQSGEIRPSIWLNGAIVGRWELGEVTDSISVSYDLYSQLSSEVRTRIQEQHKSLETFLNKRLLPISQSSK
jgi:hypothetical protein